MDEGEHERLHREQQERAGRYGIAPKPGGHLTPPAGYPDDPDQYGDPVNYRYPIDDEHVRAALSYFNQTDHRTDGGYSVDEWAIIGKRIAQAASRLLDAEYEYRDGGVVRADEKSLAVKIVGEDGDTIRVAGWGVVYGGVDLEGDRFTPETDFWLDRPAGPRPVLYEHSFNAPGLRTLGAAGVEARADGLWVEAELDRHNEYVQMIRQLLDAGVLGWSSGAVSHLVRREQRDGVRVITSWPIAEFSLTPTPAEPRTLGVSEVRALVDACPELKSLSLSGEADGVASADGEAEVEAEGAGLQTGAADSAPQRTDESEEGNEMDEQKIAEIVEGAIAKALGPERDAGMVTSAQDQPAGFVDFLRAVARRDDTVLKAFGVKAALSGSSGETGGYTIPPQFVDSIFSIAGEQSFVLRNARVYRVHGPLTQPAYDLSAGASGVPAWFGGIRLYWHEEGATLNESEPGYEQIQLHDHGLGAFAYVSNRLLSASAAQVDADLKRLFADAIAWYLDWAFLRGDGAGKPLGILNAPSLVTVTRSGSSAFTVSDAGGMLARLLPSSVGRAVWLMNPTVIPKLLALGTNYVSTWQSDLQAGLAGRLFGMPIIFTEKLPTLGTSGDVILADLSYYAVLLPSEAEIAVSEHYRFIYDQTTFRANVWVDGQPLVSSAITLADGSTTVSPFVALTTA